MRTFLRPSREATGATAAFLATVTGALTATAEPRKVEVMAAIVYVCVFLDGCEECGIELPLATCSWRIFHWASVAALLTRLEDYDASPRAFFSDYAIIESCRGSG
jgi:hypothetical protein